MTNVGKYNLFKGISTILTIGTPIASLMSCSELFVHRSDTAISVAGVCAVTFSIIFLKDKILENIKMPSPFIISLIGLILVSLVESIIYPLKIVFLTTMAVTGVDLVTFRRMYKNIENELDEATKNKFKFGFIFR